MWSAFTTSMPPSHVAIVARVLARQSAKLQQSKRSDKFPSSSMTGVMMTDQDIAEMTYFNDREEQWYRVWNIMIYILFL